MEMGQTEGEVGRKGKGKRREGGEGEGRGKGRGKEKIGKGGEGSPLLLGQIEPCIYLRFFSRHSNVIRSRQIATC